MHETQQDVENENRNTTFWCLVLTLTGMTGGFIFENRRKYFGEQGGGG